MSDNASFSSIGKQITLRADLSEFSGRDKVNLLITLLDEAGIREYAADNLSESEKSVLNAALVHMTSKLCNS